MTSVPRSKSTSYVRHRNERRIELREKVTSKERDRAIPHRPHHRSLSRDRGRHYSDPRREADRLSSRLPHHERALSPNRARLSSRDRDRSSKPSSRSEPEAVSRKVEIRPGHHSSSRRSSHDRDPHRRDAHHTRGSAPRDDRRPLRSPRASDQEKPRPHTDDKRDKHSHRHLSPSGHRKLHHHPAESSDEPNRPDADSNRELRPDSNEKPDQSPVQPSSSSPRASPTHPEASASNDGLVEVKEQDQAADKLRDDKVQPRTMTNDVDLSSPSIANPSTVDDDGPGDTSLEISPKEQALREQERLALQAKAEREAEALRRRQQIDRLRGSEPAPPPPRNVPKEAKVIQTLHHLKLVLSLV